MIQPGMRTPPADTTKEVTDRYTRAYNLNIRISTSGQTAQLALYDMCLAIKEMRDDKLYKELGYQNFEDYCEKEVGLKRRQAYNYIAIIEKLPTDFVQPVAQIGMRKLLLLTTITEEQREEITQTTDLKSVSVRDLQEKIKDLKAANDRLMEKVGTAEQDAQKAKSSEQKAWGKVTILQTDSDFQKQKIEQLEAQVQELESRPVEVAVPVVDHEKENLMKAMQKLNTDTAVRMQEIQNEHSRHVIDLNRQHTAELEQVRQEYESRLAAIPAAVTDEKAVFKAFLANLVDSGKRLIAYLASNPNPEFSAQAAKTFDTMKQEVTNGTTV